MAILPNISPRDAATEKAEAWEKKRYEDILTQKDIPVYSYRIINEFDHDERIITKTEGDFGREIGSDMRLFLPTSDARTISSLNPLPTKIILRAN